MSKLGLQDTAAFEGWALLIVQKFATAQRFWASPGHQSFCGSDDRIGADFENTPASEHEKTRYYKMLSVQAVLEYARAVALCAACAMTSTETSPGNAAPASTTVCHRSAAPHGPHHAGRWLRSLLTTQLLIGVLLALVCLNWGFRQRGHAHRRRAAPDRIQGVLRA